MTKIIISILSVMICLLTSQTASAALIDFRLNNPWEAGDSLAQYSYTYSSGALSGLTVTLEARYGSNNDDAYIWHNGLDGLGVFYHYEDDEIEMNEKLIIKFSQSIFLNTVYIANLFENEYQKQGQNKGTSINESGRYRLHGETGWSSWYNFGADSDTGPNGELAIDIGEELIDAIKFKGIEYANTGEEFAVQGLYVTPVPAPAAGLLLCSGLIGLAGINFRRIKFKLHRTVHSGPAQK